MHCTGGGFNWGGKWHRLTLKILSESSRLVDRYIRASDSFYTSIHCKNSMHKLPVKSLDTSHSTALFLHDRRRGYDEGTLVDLSVKENPLKAKGGYFEDSKIYNISFLLFYHFSL